MSAFTDFANTVQTHFPKVAFNAAVGAGTAFFLGHRLLTGATFGAIAEIFSVCTKDLIESRFKGSKNMQLLGKVVHAVATGVAATVATAALVHPISYPTACYFAASIIIAGMIKDSKK